MSPSPCPATVEEWAYQYITTRSLTHKIRPPAVPRALGDQKLAPPEAPGRPPELKVSRQTGKAPKPGALVAPKARALLLHRFWHHELQAAELMCWALLKFADAETEFRLGLAGIAQDEIRHMALYQQHIERLGFELGDFPVRDWFWERVPQCRTKLNFVAIMGLGLEAANLEHAARFARWFRQAGDVQGAALQEQVGKEEEAHVRFGCTWFERWQGTLQFEDWKAALPPPLSPLLMRGTPLNQPARSRAGLNQAFLTSLDQWQPEDSGS